MADLSRTWLNKAADAIRNLADRPWTLFALLLAMNALARPCYATAHDAHLYSLQALNQAEAGAFAEDVFLRFGSQDQFSLFSRLVAPLVAAVGVRLAFLLLYLVFNMLFIFGLFRLVRALIDDALISTLALVYLVTASLPYGGFEIFTVHEPFFTPRTVGTALTLLALERLVQSSRHTPCAVTIESRHTECAVTIQSRHTPCAYYFAQSFALLMVAMLMHPLMACGGVMIWLGYVACAWLPTRIFVGIGVATLVGAATVLGIPALGTRLFGTMDDDWHQLIRASVGYNYPASWHLKDWLNLAVSFVLPIAVCCGAYRHDPERRRFFLIVVLAGAVGFLATLAASFLPYALLFQGQPYRVLWILKVLQVPLGFLLIARWRDGEPNPVRSRVAQPGSLRNSARRIAALALIAFFCIAHYLVPEFVIFAMMLAISLCFARLNGEAERAGWWWHAGARGLVLGALGWMTYRCWFLFDQREVIARTFDFDEWRQFDLISPMFWLVGLCFVASRRWLDVPRPSLGWSAAAVGIVTPIALFGPDMSLTFRRDHTRLGPDVALVRDFIHQHHADSSRHPSIYWSLGRTDLVWTDVKATSYFGILQTAGVMFNRQTAAEIERRGALVRKFEMARERGTGVFLDDEKKVGMEMLFQIPVNSPPPSRDDLTRLCQEPGLDYVVTTHEFPGLYSASNGRIYVYDCHKIRAETGLAFSARATPGER